MYSTNDLNAFINASYPSLWIQTTDYFKGIELLIETQESVNPEQKIFYMHNRNGLCVRDEGQWRSILHWYNQSETFDQIFDFSIAVEYVYDQKGLFILPGDPGLVGKVGATLLDSYGAWRSGVFNNTAEAFMKFAFVGKLITDKIDPLILSTLWVVNQQTLDVQSSQDLYTRIGSSTPELIEPASLTALVRQTSGFTENQALASSLKSVTENNKIDPTYIEVQRRKIIGESGILEVLKPSIRMDEIGGLQAAKDVLKGGVWINQNPEKAKELGLTPPNRMLLIGVPGSGKSALCEATAHDLGYDMVKFGVGKMMSKWIGECHADDTEFLTDRGMLPFDEITETDSLAVWDPNTESLNYEHPTARHEYHFEGDMVYLPGRGALVTPNHRMVTNRPKSHGRTDWEFIEAGEAFSLNNIRIPVAPSEVEDTSPDKITVSGQSVRHGKGDQSVTVDTLEMLELLGYFVADGHIALDRRGPVILTQQEGSLANRMLELLGQFGNAVVVGRDKRSDPACLNLSVQSIPLWHYLEENCGTHHYNKRLPSWVMGAGSKKLSILWDALMATDGYSDPRGFPSQSYSTTSPVLAEQVQEIAFKLGKRVTVREEVRQAPSKNCYIISVTPKNYQTIQPSRAEYASYSGRVVCFSVPTGTLVTRREGRWIISGNSESNMRAAFDQMNAMTPITIWIDELGRDLSGSHTSNDGGTTDRAHGELLSGLQELDRKNVLMAAANRIDGLPPEMLRADRFDKILFVGFPSPEERVAILRIYLGQDVPEESVRSLIKVTESYTGAEIKAAIAESRFDIGTKEHRAPNIPEIGDALVRYRNRVWLRRNAEIVHMYKQAINEWDWASDEQKDEAKFYASGRLPSQGTTKTKVTV